jgi:hypothetical protein
MRAADGCPVSRTNRRAPTPLATRLRYQPFVSIAKSAAENVEPTFGLAEFQHDVPVGCHPAENQEPLGDITHRFPVRDAAKDALTGAEPIRFLSHEPRLTLTQIPKYGRRCRFGKAAEFRWRPGVRPERKPAKTADSCSIEKVTQPFL